MQINNASYTHNPGRESTISFSPLTNPFVQNQPHAPSIFNRKLQSSLDKKLDIMSNKRLSIQLNSKPNKIYEQNVSADYFEEELRNIQCGKIGRFYSPPIKQYSQKGKHNTIKDNDSVFESEKNMILRYGNITKLTQEQNTNLKQQNQYLMKQLMKAKQKSIKMSKLYDGKYNEYKKYKAMSLSNLKQIELKSKQSHIYACRCEELARIIHYDFGLLKQKVQAEFRFNHRKSQNKQKGSSLAKQKYPDFTKQKSYNDPIFEYYQQKKHSAPTTHQSNEESRQKTLDQQDKITFHENDYL